jgi:hypothetical protein
MRVAMRMVLIVTLVLNLAGCYSIVKMPDIATAAVYGPQVSGGPLSPQQVARLSSWIHAHDAGWRGWMEARPAPITMSIVMHDPSGRQSSLELFESKDGSAMAYLHTPSSAQPLERYLPAAEVVALKAALGN